MRRRKDYRDPHKGKKKRNLIKTERPGKIQLRVVSMESRTELKSYMNEVESNQTISAAEFSE